MKIEKLKFEQTDKFKELIELTGLVSYTFDSDGGRGLFIQIECIKEHNVDSELKDFLIDFHCEHLYAEEGSATLELNNEGVLIKWSSKSDLLLEYVQSDFNEMLCALFSLPNEAPIDILFKLHFKIDGVLTRDLELQTFAFILNINSTEIEEYGFSSSELKKIKNGLLFNNTHKIQELFEKHLKKLLKKYHANNCTFYIVGDECNLSFFEISQIENRTIVLI
jgi:hypothetical protein